MTNTNDGSNGAPRATANDDANSQGGSKVGSGHYKNMRGKNAPQVARQSPEIGVLTAEAIEKLICERPDEPLSDADAHKLMASIASIMRVPKHRVAIDRLCERDAIRARLGYKSKTKFHETLDAFADKLEEVKTYKEREAREAERKAAAAIRGPGATKVGDVKLPHGYVIEHGKIMKLAEPHGDSNTVICDAFELIATTKAKDTNYHKLVRFNHRAER